MAEFQKLFLDTWQKQKGPVLSERGYFPDLKAEGNALVRVVGSTQGENNRIPFIMYVSAITFAEHSIHMTNSYFIPDDQIVKALTDAAGRGVDVKIILPGVTDSQLALYAQKYYYSKFLKSGVKLYEHSTFLLHAKTAVVDKVWSTIGSTNMDFLSLLNNDEVNAVILSHEFAVVPSKWRRCLSGTLRIPGRFNGISGKKDLCCPGSGSGLRIYFPIGCKITLRWFIFIASIHRSYSFQ